MLKTVFFTIVLSFIAVIGWAQENVVQHLQDISVTIKAGGSQGSGVLFTRKVDDDTVSWIWTAGHVIDGLRSSREIISDGNKKIVVEFKDAVIVQEFRENGRRIGEANFDAQVIRYSDATNGEDLALLRVRKKNFVPENVTTKFYLDDAIPPIGTELYHVGSLLGQVGSNSLTTGVVSQIGRVLNLGSKGTVFDQTTAVAYPGSSGGGVYLKSDGRYVGMLVRGAGESFNLIVPSRRLKEWASKANILWAIDPNVPLPTEDELLKLPVEDTGVIFENKSNDNTHPVMEENFPFLINLENKEI